MKNYGDKIVELRKMANITQVELGEELNVTAQAVSKWENGLAEPDLETINKMCELFNVSPNEFFGLENTPNSNGPVQEQKPIQGYCERCSKPLYVGEYKVKTVETRVSHGRTHHNVTSQHLYCNDCFKKVEKEEQEKRIAEAENKINEQKHESRKELRRGLGWGTVAAIVALVASIIGFNLNGVNVTSTIIGTVILTYVGFSLVCQIFWFGTVCDILMFFMRSFQMPGVIFGLSIDSIVLAIALKLSLFVLSICLSILCFLVGVAIAMFCGIFIFPFALSSKIKEV